MEVYNVRPCASRGPTRPPSPQEQRLSRFIPMSQAPETKLVLEWGEGFQKRDPSHLAKYLHKDFRHITLPSSINRQPQTKDEWIEKMSQIFPLWAETEVSYLSYLSNLLRPCSISLVVHPTFLDRSSREGYLPRPYSERLDLRCIYST